jgi:hypothetical protein
MVLHFVKRYPDYLLEELTECRKLDIEMIHTSVQEKREVKNETT